jgi:hypothetical protein
MQFLDLRAEFSLTQQDGAPAPGSKSASTRSSATPICCVLMTPFSSSSSENLVRHERWPSRPCSSAIASSEDRIYKGRRDARVRRHNNADSKLGGPTALGAP